MQSLIRQKWFSILLILIGASSYGLLSPFIKVAYQRGLAESDITSGQATIGTVIMWLLVLVTPEARKSPFTGPWVKLALIGMFGLSFTTIFYNRTLTELDASLSIVLLFQFTWITIVMECVAGKKWPTLYQSLAVAIVMVGTVLSVNLFSANLERFSPLGLVYGLASGVTYSLFLFAAGRVESNHHPLLKSAWMLTAGLVVIYLFYPPTFVTGPNSGTLIGWGLLLGLLGQVVPTISFLIGIPRVGASLAAMLGSMELPVAVIGAYIIIGEHVTTVQWLGMLLILGGVLVSEIKAAKKLTGAE